MADPRLSLQSYPSLRYQNIRGILLFTSMIAIKSINFRTVSPEVTLGRGRWRIHPYSKLAGSLTLGKEQSNPHLEIEEEEIEVLEVKRGKCFETANSCNNMDSEEPNIEERGSVSSRNEEEEEYETISDGYDEIEDGTKENESRGTTLHEYVIEQLSVDTDQDKTMWENSMCESDNARESERGNESFDILTSGATSAPDMWNLEDCNQPELPIASTDNWSSRSNAYQGPNENWEGGHRDSQEWQHGIGGGPRGLGERQDKPEGSGLSQDEDSEMSGSEDFNLPKDCLELMDTHTPENEERKCEDSKKLQTEEPKKDQSDLTNKRSDLHLHDRDANPTKGKDYSLTKDREDSNLAKDEDEDLTRDEDLDTYKDEDEDLLKAEDIDLTKDEDLVKDENSDLAKGEDEDLPKCSDVQNTEDSSLSSEVDVDFLYKDSLLPTNDESALPKEKSLDLPTEESESPRPENPAAPKGADTGLRENGGSDRKEKKRVGGDNTTERVSCCKEQATKNPELDPVSSSSESELIKKQSTKANKTAAAVLAIQPSNRKLRRRKNSENQNNSETKPTIKVISGRKNLNGKYSATKKDSSECEPLKNGLYSDAAISSGKLRLEVTVDVSDSNPISDYEDICSKTVSTLKPCYVRLAKMDMIPSSILKKLGLKTQSF